MIRVDIPEKMVKMAEELSKEMGCLKNSITKGGGNVAGFLGEMLVLSIYGGVWDSTYNSDVIINGRTGDVKTKRCTGEPRCGFWCTVAATSSHQVCDDYYFVRILDDLSMGWICGYISQEEFIRHAQFHRKDDPDPTKPEWPFRADCYNMSIQEVRNRGGLFPHGLYLCYQ